MQVGWLNPALGSQNTGDEIIADAVRVELNALGLKPTEFSTRRAWTRAERAAARTCGLFFLGGTNILSSEPQKYRQWIFGLRDANVMRSKVVLTGVGWWQYQDRPNALARTALGWLLSPTVAHAVRDSYTERQLAGIDRPVLMTSCPTAWSLDRHRGARVDFSGRIVATITDYLRDPVADGVLLSALRERAAVLTVWPQGHEDADYVRSLGFGEHLSEPGLSTFAGLLRPDDACYVGTRLHAGIRAMQLGRASLIVAIDNRAAEMGADIGFTTVPRTDLREDTSALWRAGEFEIRLPRANIDRWRRSVRDAVAGGAV